MAKCYAAVCLLQLLLVYGDFLTDISQGSVATYLRCGGMFKSVFVANLPLSMTAKEFRKLLNIWGSHRQELNVLFFDSRCNCLKSS